MNPARSPEQGEVLKLGPPAAGEVTIAVDPNASATAFAAGTQTLRPGAEIPVQRHLDRDVALFVHKGQGRATLNERSLIVLPGAMLYVPRGAWHGVHNTGTGDLQIAWVSSPGVEVFFRDLSRAGASPSAQVLQELAQRHRIEFRPATAAPVPAARHHRGHRGGRQHRVGRTPARPGSSESVATPPPARIEASSPTPVSPGVGPVSSTVPDASAASRAPHGHSRRRHRRGASRQPGGWRHSLTGKDSPGSVAGQRPTPPAAPPEHRDKTGGAPSVPLPASTSGSARPGAGRQQPPRGRYRRRIKEVYMGGQWVQVEGEGPTIAPRSPRPGRRGPKQDGDGEPPGVSLGVQL